MVGNNYQFSDGDNSRILYFVNRLIEESKTDERSLTVSLAQEGSANEGYDLVKDFAKYYFYIIKGTLDYIEECVETNNDDGLLVSLNFIQHDVVFYLKEKYKNKMKPEFYDKALKSIHDTTLGNGFVVSIYTSGKFDIKYYVNDLIGIFYRNSLTDKMKLEDVKEQFYLDNPHYQGL